jgi:hypothetical protein
MNENEHETAVDKGAQMIAAFMTAARAVEKLDAKDRIRAVKALAELFGVDSEPRSKKTLPRRRAKCRRSGSL